MLKIIPDWAIFDEEFWQSIRKRNLWFIKLRYLAVFALFFFIIGYKYIIDIKLSSTQSNVILLISSIILLYNLVFHYLIRFLRNEANAFNPIHLSILQMVLDLIMLLLLVFYSGGIDSPFPWFFIFHMIASSLILPGIIVYSLAISVIISFWGITIGSFYNIFEYYPIEGFIINSNYQNFHYVLGTNIVFAIVIMVTVLIANYIAKQLYQNEQQLYSYMHKLNQAEKEKTKFIVGIAHELKTPLSALNAYLDLVLQKFVGPLDELVEEKLIRAKRRSDEAIEMINTLLKVSQLKMMDEISFEEFDPDEICKAAISRHEQFAKNKYIEIRYFDERNDKSIRLKGVRFLVMIALSNLIGNAVKYGFENGLIEIKIYETDDNFVFEVCDNGCGIPEAEQQNIFKDFFRASNVRKMVSDGAGIGLSLVKQIVEKHNGEITFQSPSRLQVTDKPGTCFKITLPIRD